jgi:hypothetical protein
MGCPPARAAIRSATGFHRSLASRSMPGMGAQTIRALTPNPHERRERPQPARRRQGSLGGTRRMCWNAHTTLMTTFPVARPDSE